MRKRKTPPPAPVRPTKKKTTKAEKPPAKASVAEKAKAAVTEAVETVKEAVTGEANGEDAAKGSPKVGESIDLSAGGFAGEVETHDGKKTSLAKLVEESKSGVVLFTYPKASTPGCTKQVCFFRDSYTPLTATGFDIYGLSNDSPKANTTFATKQKLPYPLLCDPSRTLITAIGLSKAPKGTTRGIFIIDKSGKVLAAEPGGPDGTLQVARKILAADDSAPAEASSEKKEDVQAAETAGEVADTAADIDADKT